MIWLYPRQCLNIFSLSTTQIYLPMITKLKKGHKIEGWCLSNKLILIYTFNLGCHHGRQFIQNSFFQILFFTDNMIIFFLTIYYLMFFFSFSFQGLYCKTFFENENSSNKVLEQKFVHSTYYWSDFNRYLIDVWTSSTINIKSNFQNRYGVNTKLYGLPSDITHLMIANTKPDLRSTI